MKQNPNWTYADHQNLGMKYAVRKTDGTLMTEDKTAYSKKEIDILGGADKITPGLHMVKQVFEGEVVRYAEN